jgi:N utilization substance protein B
LKRIELVLRAILRAGGYEMMFRKDVPVRVVINEYVEVAHLFYSEEEPRLVNGVLDAIGRKLRAGEMAPR